MLNPLSSVHDPIDGLDLRGGLHSLLSINNIAHRIMHIMFLNYISGANHSIFRDHVLPSFKVRISNFLLRNRDRHNRVTRSLINWWHLLLHGNHRDCRGDHGRHDLSLARSRCRQHTLHRGYSLGKRSHLAGHSAHWLVSLRKRVGTSEHWRRTRHLSVHWLSHWVAASHLHDVTFACFYAEYLSCNDSPIL